MKHSLSTALDDMELRPLEPGDIEPMRLLRNSNRRCFVYEGEISEAAQRAWYEKYLAAPGDYMFSVWYQQRWVGAVALYDVADGEAEFGRLIIDREKARRGGLGVAAARAVCKLGFQELGLRRIRLEVFEDNPAARKTYERAGFRYTGQIVKAGARPLVMMELEPGDLV